MSYFSKVVLTSAIAASASVTSSAFAQGTSIDCGQTYSVVRGDTLSQINNRAYGNFKFQALFKHNANIIGSNPNRIYVGMLLEVPCENADGTFAAMPGETPAADVVQITQAVQGTQPTDDGTALVSDDGTVVLSFNKTSAPPFVINSGIIDIYLAQITEVTDGRVTFVNPDIMNRDPEAQFDLVTSGQVDGAYVLNSLLAETHPLLQLPMLPLQGGSAEQTATALWRLHEEHLSKSDYFDEAQLLGFVAAPAAHIWRKSDAPVSAVENIAEKNDYAVPYFKGLDVRGPKVLREEVSSWMEAYKAENTEDPTFFLAHGAARAVGIWTEDMTVTEVDYGLYTPTFSVILSNEAWAQISPADRDAIMEISGEKLAMRSASWDAFDNGFRADMVANNLKIVKADAGLLSNLEQYAADGILTWSRHAVQKNIAADEAVASYQNALRALEDRLLFR